MPAEPPPIVLVRALDNPHATRQQHARAACTAAEVRVARGAYLSAASWQRLNARERYLARVRAVAETRRTRPVLSHWSAAAVHGLPIMGGWPQEVHTSAPPASGGRSRNSVVRHAALLSDADIVTVDGMLVTSPARTAVDLATVGTFMAGALIVDRVLHVNRHDPSAVPNVTKACLHDTWERALPFRGHRRALRVIDFGVDCSDSALETVSRVNMMVIGCPRPLLQTPYSDYQGFIGEVDFDWPEFGVVGEADGAVKYFAPAFGSGRTPEQILLAEKDRHDRLTALPKRVPRWRWSVGVSAPALRDRLSQAGLPMGIRWTAPA